MMTYLDVFMSIPPYANTAKWMLTLALLVNSIWVLRAALGSMFDPDAAVTARNFYIVPGHALLTIAALTFLV